jgi:hypothetical protein
MSGFDSTTPATYFQGRSRNPRAFPELDAVEAAPRLHLHVAMPSDPYLARLCERLTNDPTASATLERLAARVSFGEWLRPRGCCSSCRGSQLGIGAPSGAGAWL